MSTHKLGGSDGQIFARRDLVTGAAAMAVAGFATNSIVIQDSSAQTLIQPSAQTDSSETIAETSKGKIRGVVSSDGVHTFRGIPYGQETSGKNRFMPPKKPESWSGIRDCTRWGSKSLQVPPVSQPEGLLFLNYVEVPGGQSEDCLVLNVWTRAKRDGKKRAVMVRIHGGGFTTGSGNNPMYWGHASARDHDVVYVSMNHRLNAYGFLDLSTFGGAEFQYSGNVGMLDLVACLEWVRDNIENFGGDPGNVMIMGESGGGAKIATLMAMPGAKGLFHKAVIESGPMMSAMPPEMASATAKRVLDYLEVTKGNLGKLQSMHPNRILEAQAYVQSKRLNTDQGAAAPLAFAPVRDGTVIPQNPFEPVANPLSADIPLMIGYNKDEATFFLQNDEEMYRIDDAGLKTQIARSFGANTDEVISAFRNAHPQASASQLLVMISTEQSMGYGSTILAERHAALGKAATYMYRFDWQSPAWKGKLGAPHGINVCFSTGDANNQECITLNSPSAQVLAKKVNASWVAFAQSGDPNVPSLPKWDPYSAQHRAIMRINDSSELAVDADPGIRQLWERVKPRGLMG